MEEDEIEIYKKAVEMWGRNAQSDMLIEECSELIKAVVKDRRGKITLDDIMSELVDVQIMINQMRIILNDESKYERWFAFKMDKLKSLIEKGTIAQEEYEQRRIQAMNRYSDGAPILTPDDMKALDKIHA